MIDPDLTTLSDLPQLTITIEGREYGFSELPLGQLAKLQAWIKDHVLHPVRVIIPYLDGLPEKDRQYLLDQARMEARQWPPQVGTAAGAAVLLGSEPGQVEALAAGLSVHHPELSRRDVDRLYRALRRDAGRQAKEARKAGREYDGEGDVKRIFGVLFGLDDGDDESPKGYPGRAGTLDGALTGR